MGLFTRDDSENKMAARYPRGSGKQKTHVARNAATVHAKLKGDEKLTLRSVSRTGKCGWLFGLDIVKKNRSGK